MLFSVLHRRPPFVHDGESEDMARLRILRAEPLYEPPAGSGQERLMLSEGAAACLQSLLHREWRQRPSAEEALKHPWLLAMRKGAGGGGSGGGGTRQPLRQQKQKKTQQAEKAPASPVQAAQTFSNEGHEDNWASFSPITPAVADPV